jgi:hypothetical protein
MRQAGLILEGKSTPTEPAMFHCPTAMGTHAAHAHQHQQTRRKVVSAMYLSNQYIQDIITRQIMRNYTLYTCFFADL